MKKYLFLALAAVLMFSCEDQGPKVEVGYYYFNDGTTSYSMGDTRPAGIVFRVPTKNQPGLAVSYDEPEKNLNYADNPKGCLFWSNESVEVDDVDDYYCGLSNMAELIEHDSTFENYPAFAWVHAKNPKNTVYTEDAKNIWYLPSQSELLELYASLPIVNERFGFKMPKIEVGDETYYMSSTQYEDYSDLVWSVLFKDGSETNRNKQRNSYVRAIIAF